MKVVYGLIIFFVAYAILYWLYSVNYLGVSTLYDSTITQILFPFAKHRLFPTWGFNKLGMMNADLTKYGSGRFWPESSEYQPRREASGGMSPEGGMREVSAHPTMELRDGYKPVPLVQNIYDSSEIPEEVSINVGWWGH